MPDHSMKIGMRSIQLFLIILYVGLLTGCEKPKENIYENYSWITKIRDDHPRLFFNKESFKQIQKRALNEEQELFGEIKSRVDILIGQKIEFKNPLEPELNNYFRM